MAYQSVTDQLVKLAELGTQIRRDIIALHGNGILNNHSAPTRASSIESIKDRTRSWTFACADTLEKSELMIEYYRFQSVRIDHGYLQFGELAVDYTKLVTEVNLIMEFAQNIEVRQISKSVVPIFIDDIDAFSGCAGVTSADVEEYSKGAFLEDDVIDAFCEALGEPYTETHSGSETRDLYTTRLTVGGKRLRTVAMFKGRGVNHPLRIRDCGSQGNQLLKLAKNTSAQLFIVQHVHKIDPEVEEALRDHVLSLTMFSTVYFCSIDGIDTARFLKGMGKNLEELAGREGRK